MGLLIVLIVWLCRRHKRKSSSSSSFYKSLDEPHVPMQPVAQPRVRMVHATCIHDVDTSEASAIPLRARESAGDAAGLGGDRRVGLGHDARRKATGLGSPRLDSQPLIIETARVIARTT